MTDAYLKAASISETSHKTDKDLVRALLYPLPDLHGFLFCLLTSRGGAQETAALGRILEEHLSRAAQTLDQETHLLHRFEQLVEAINERIAQESQQDEWSLHPSLVSSLVGIAAGKTLYLTGVGDLNAFYFHRTPERKYQIFNLSRGLQTEQTAPSWRKFYSVLLDGDLHVGDVFCASNVLLQQTIPSEDLHGILTSLPPASSCSKIRQYYGISVDLSLIVLKVEGPEEKPVAPARSDASIRHLDETTKDTRRWLEDQRPRASALAKHAGRLAVGLWQTLSRIAFWRRVWLALPQVPRRLKAAAPVLRDRLSLHRSPRAWWDPRHWEVRTRWMVAGCAVVLLLLVIGGVSISRAMERRAEEKKFVQAVTGIETLRDRAKSALIYKNTEVARTAINQASQALAALGTVTPERETRVTALKNEVDTIRRDLRKSTALTDPQTLYTASGDGPGLVSLAPSSTLYGLLGNGSIVSLSFSGGQLWPAAPESPTAPGRKLSAEGDVLASLGQDNSLILVNVKEKTGTKVTSGSGTDPWSDLIAYGERVYVLTSKTILRMERTGIAVSEAAPWLRTPADLSQTVGLAVDGTVFVGFRNGQLKRLKGGVETAWIAQKADPPLTSITEIWTSRESASLYVLDASQSRIVVFDKETGALTKQYEAGELENTKDLWVDEANKKLIVVSAEKATAWPLK